MGSAGMKRRGRKHLHQADGAQAIGGRGRQWFGGGAYGATPWGIGGAPSRYQWRPIAGFALAIAVGLGLIALYVVLAS